MIDKYWPDSLLTSGQKSNSVWLTIKPKKVVKVNLDTRFRGSIDTVPDNENTDPLSSIIYNFLLPKEVSIGISHRWEDYANVIGEIRELASSLKQQGGQIQPIVDSLKKVIDGKSPKEALSSLAGWSEGIQLIANKNDNPIIYNNSERKMLSFDLEFAMYSDPKADVYDPIHSLLELSSPDKTGSTIEFVYPYVFEVSTTYNGVTVPLLGIKNAAIRSMQPTFKGPYIKGYPSKAELTLQFEDIDPLYRSNSWTDNNKVTVDFGDTKQESLNIQENSSSLTNNNLDYWHKTDANSHPEAMERTDIIYSSSYDNLSNSSAKSQARATEAKAATIGTLNTQNIRYWLPYAGYIKTVVPPLGG